MTSFRKGRKDRRFVDNRNNYFSATAAEEQKRRPLGAVRSKVNFAGTP